MMWVRYGYRTGLLLTAIFLSVLPSAAQMEIGDDWKFNLNGNIGYNYNGSINDGSSAHGMGFFGDANLRGTFYSPNFLNFNVQPYYDRTQSNSVYGALTNSSGVSANANLFSGSHFPGSFSYNKGNNNVGQFGIPSSDIGLAEHGNLQAFGLTWSALLPNLPTLTASYLINDESSSIYGTQEQNSQKDRTLLLLSTYRIAGFNLGGQVTHRNADSSFNNVVDGLTEPTNTTSVNNSYQVNGQHSFPMQGSFGLAWTRSDYGYDYHDSVAADSSGRSDTLNGNLNFRPASKLTVGVIGNYQDSLLGAVPEVVLNSGTVINSPSLGSFRSFLMGGMANYQVGANLSLQGIVNREQQSFLGKTYSATQYGGNVNYNLNRKLLGSMTFSFAMFDTANQDGNSALGFTGNLNFSRKIDGWDVDANVSYSQNVQTMILLYTTSSIGYVSNVRRRLGNRTYFSAGFGGSHSALAAQSGSSSSSERWSSTLTYHSYSLNGFYSKADGAALFTPNGLVSIPTNLPPVVFGPGAVITYGSKAYGLNASAVVMRRLTISGGYSDSKGRTVDPLISTLSDSRLYNAIMQYRLRKVFLNGGFTKLNQSVGIAGTPPVMVTAYYIGVSRWFNFF